MRRLLLAFALFVLCLADPGASQWESLASEALISQHEADHKVASTKWCEAADAELEDRIAKNLSNETLETDRVNVWLKCVSSSLRAGEYETAVNRSEVAATFVSTPEMKSELFNNLAVAHSALNQPRPTIAALKKALAAHPSPFVEMNLLRVQHESAEWGNIHRLYKHAAAICRNQSTPEWTGQLALEPQHVVWYPLEPNLIRNCIAAARTRYIHAVVNIPGLQQTKHILPNPVENLRIGFMAHGYRTQRVGRTIHALALYAKTQIFIVALGEAPELPEQVKNTQVISVDGLSVKDAAAEINKHQLQVLIDLEGFPENGATHNINRGISIMLLEPAPLRFTFTGFQAGLNAPKEISHFFVADPITSPPEFAAHSLEPLALLPTTFLPHILSTITEARRRGRESAGWPDGPVAYTSKYVDQDASKIWMRMMDFNTSILLFVPSTFAAVEGLQNLAEKERLNPDKIVRWESVDPNFQLQLGGISLFDVMLDSTVVSAREEAIMALYMGLPIITNPGWRASSRVAASAAINAGRTWGIARTRKEYSMMARKTFSNHLALVRKEHKEFFTARAGVRLYQSEAIVNDVYRMIRMMFDTMVASGCDQTMECQRHHMVVAKH